MRWIDINVLPVKQETIVLPYGADESRWRLWHVTKPIRSGEAMPDVPEEKLLFNGSIENYNFVLYRKVRYPENFMPVMKGSIEETPLGSIVFLKYRMFMSTILFLVFWCTVAFLMSLYLLLFVEHIGYSAIAFSLGLVNYLVVMHGFNRQVKKSQHLIHEVFMLPDRTN